MTKPKVTVAALIYKDPAWLEFMLEGLAAARSRMDFDLMVVANNATEEVRELPDVTHEYPDQGFEHYMQQVYAAWNFCFEKCDTEWVVPINSDMYVSDLWLDGLFLAKERHPDCIPTSCLVESGRPELIPKYPGLAKNFGVSPADFNRGKFILHAEQVRSNAVEPGGLYMPALFNTEQVRSVGYSTYRSHCGRADRLLFADMKRLYGLSHVTAFNSVVYHVQEGEMRS